MKMLPHKVLLLGWDDTPPAPEQPRPGPLALASRLASGLALSVLLPHLPEVVSLIPQTQVTGLGNLDPQQVAQAPVQPGAWQAPAAPYAGAETPPPAATAPETAPAARVTVVGAGLPARAGGPAPEAAEPAAEPGPAEANDLSQPADDLTPAAAPAEDASAAEDPEPAAAAAAEQPTLKALAALRAEAADEADLNFRVIQYARFAAPQAAGQEFAVIYAPSWPVWLAALEIRSLTGRPLVLHVHSLAADRNTPADRGWALELERLALRRADLVLAASPAVAERLQALYRLPAGRCRVVGPDDAPTLTEVLNSFIAAG